jgi:hypothetical protein
VYLLFWFLSGLLQTKMFLVLLHTLRTHRQLSLKAVLLFPVSYYRQQTGYIKSLAEVLVTQQWTDSFEILWSASWCARPVHQIFVLLTFFRYVSSVPVADAPAKLS